MQLEKKDTAKSKRYPQKHFPHRQVPSQLWRALSNETPEIQTYLYMKTTSKLEINIL
jgi:hypothetical protein